MEAYQLRVIAERAELNERLRKLIAYLESSAGTSVPIDEWELMHRQAKAMIDLSEVLGARVRVFT